MRSAEELSEAPRTSFGRFGWAGTMLAFALPLVLLGWMQSTVVGGAVLGSGEVAVRGQPKAVQSLEGGVVARIEVAEGAEVEAGQVVMRLDPALVEIEVDIAARRLGDAALRVQRLQAEIAGAAAPDFSALPEGARVEARDVEAQRAVFDARRAVRAGLHETLVPRVEAAEAEVEAVEARLGDLTERLTLARRERDRLADLAERGLAPRADLTPADERVSVLAGELAAARAARAAALAGIRSARLEVVQAERGFYQEATDALGAARLEQGQILLELARLEARRDGLVLRAPAAGIVHDLRVVTTGGVVAPRETVMQIVPVGEGVEFAVRIEPRAIDEVHVGQAARLVLPLGGGMAPEVMGRVAQVPAAARTDPATGLAHYRLKIEAPPEELARLRTDLVPGMPVEAFLATADRSVLTYLLSPLTDQIRRAFREG